MRLSGKIYEHSRRVDRQVTLLITCSCVKTSILIRRISVLKACERQNNLLRRIGS